MAMVNLGSISSVTTRMLGGELGGVVATGVSGLLHSGGQDSLAGALGQLEKFFGPEAMGKLGSGPIAAGPLAFNAVAGQGGSLTITNGLSNPFGATQGMQPKIQGLMQGLSETLDQMLGKMEVLGQLRPQGGPTALLDPQGMAQQFEGVMDQAIKLHLSGSATDRLKSQALFQKALSMLGVPADAQAAGGAQPMGVAGGSAASSNFRPAVAGDFVPAGGGSFGGGGGGGSASGVSATGGGLDAMMAQAESLLRSDSMEAQLAGQRLMSKALRMFELISKMIEKQSEMASKAIAAIK